ncbi:MAG: hypothetical protein SFY69_05570 [Planctomycetota bacterium]|nr:hypothetical protein [Planctomycetota bacterium]
MNAIAPGHSRSRSVTPAHPFAAPTGAAACSHGWALRNFTWQEGCSIFTVSKSQEKAAKKYIAGQDEHHEKEDFKSELLQILRAHGVEFDEEFVFD